MDEIQPLLAPVPPPTTAAGQFPYIPDVNVPNDESFDHRVDFNPNGDPENPLEWPKAYHNGVILLLAFMAFTVTFTCIGVVPIARQIVLDLENQESKSASVLLVTIWELGEAAGPLLIAPLSEVYGRAAVFNVANVLFIIWTVVAACSQTSHLFILSRFMTGCAVASNVLNPAVIGDMLPPDQRGSAMATLMLAPLLGGAIGPAITGAIAQSIGWRNVLWFAAGMAGVCELCFLLLFRETYKIRILQRRIARLKKQKNEDGLALKVVVEEECEHTALAIWKAIKRPAAVFGGSFVLQILSFYGAIVFTFYYIMSTTLPEVLKNVYGFAPTTIGSSFIAFSVGSTFAVFLCNMLIDRIYVYLRTKNNNQSHPEFRMPLTIISGCILPISIALFGWTAAKGWPVAFLLFLIGLQGFAILTGMVPLMAYVVDAFGLYSASALTAVLITRCLTSTFLPLMVGPLTDRLGYGWGFMIVSGVCLVVAPVPWLVMRYGEKWRQYSAYTRDD
ncbi:uncharacterized protein EAE97_005927 [Botrytis byssoidea]|uniref:Major facilitator superfamily (MFS) profile domain-containing protein n=1 Tax=Botrytis byssoidea TaxID=139641 RepID=A0A9P5IJR4_9HELO|nr:uncharacterized protein EAE97_005927 [Botrytis byssoidea]KAF7943857.1 hypothetical protein EAE97_005927 [Botrytis byssoidea]